MITFYNSLSPTTKLLLQSFLSVLGSVLAGALAAAYQSYTQAGHVDMQALINISLLTFALLFGKAMHDWVPAHAQQLLQAANDEKVSLYDALQRQQNISQAVIATQGKHVQSASSQSQQQPSIVVQAAQLTPEHVQAISQQIALNLANMAGGPAQQNNTQTPIAPPPPPVAKDPNAYVDPLKISAVLPAYKSPIPDQTTQNSIVPQVPFAVPSRPVMP